MGSNRDSQAKFVAGTIVGALVGGIAALLLTPKTGKEHQQDLRERAKRAMQTADTRLDEIEVELEGQIANLKAAARDLHGEAYENSQRLITRAEMLKNDLQTAARRLTTIRPANRYEAVTNAKRLVNEGQGVMTELEQMTKKIIKSVPNQTGDQADDDAPTHRN